MNKIVVTATAILREVSEATLKRSEDGALVYLWIGGPGSGLSIIADSLQQLLVVRDAITEFEFREKVAEAAKRLSAEREQAEASDAA